MEPASFDSIVFRSTITSAYAALRAENYPELELPELADEHLERMIEHAQLVVDTNRTMNLTSITDPAEMAVKHYLDSLTCCIAADFATARRVCDIGTGAGYPGIPLAIVFPGVHFVLVESLQKKARFLEYVVGKLSLRNCEVLAERVEVLGQGSSRETFDIVVSRGVSSLPVLLEYSLPLVRLGGIMVAMRGLKGAEEAEKSSETALKLGGSIQTRTVLRLKSAGERFLVAVKKIGPTPEQYPRKAGIPAKRPLQ